MSSELMLRRREMFMRKPKEPDYYEGFVRGRIYSGSVSVSGTIYDSGAQASGALFVTPYLEVTGGHSLTISHTIDAHDSDINTDYALTMWVFYDENKARITYYTARGSAYKTRTAPSNAAYVRTSARISNLDDYYIKDNTTSLYVFKGKNIQ